MSEDQYAFDVRGGEEPSVSYDEVTENPDGTLSDQIVPVGSGEAAPALVVDWQNGRLKRVAGIEPGAQADAGLITDSEFAKSVVGPTFDAVMNTAGTAEEKNALLREILGTSKEIINLFSSSYGRDVA